MSVDHSLNPNIKFHPETGLENDQAIIDLAERIKSGDRYALARGISLIENQSPQYLEVSLLLLEKCIDSEHSAMTIGVSGPPGVGKSSFIESLGLHLTRLEMKPAILAIDPSSPLSGGSILGDKTRMNKLSKHPNAFIRPSPSSGYLGGIAPQSFFAGKLCEAAGYDPIVFETVGVGQSESAVRNMVDLFILLVQPGTGDELQAMKKGILEMSDIVLINKWDGQTMKIAQDSFQSLRQIIPVSQKTPKIKQKELFLISALEKKGIDKVWESILNKYNNQNFLDHLTVQRKSQVIGHFDQVAKDYIGRIAMKSPSIVNAIRESRAEIQIKDHNIIVAIRKMSDSISKILSKLEQ